MFDRFDHSEFQKRDIAQIYQGMLQGIWNYYIDALGWIATEDCMKAALENTKKSYPIIESVQLTDEGFSFASLCERTKDWEIITLQEAVKTFCTSLIDITTECRRFVRY